MLDNKGRINAALALLVLAALALACSSLKGLGKNPTQEANEFVGEARKDLNEVDKIIEENDDLLDQINKADRDKKTDEVKSLLGKAVDAIDKGIERGESAANNIDKASKLDVDAKYKEYLSLKAQAFRKTIDAFKERKKAAEIMRDNYGKGGTTEETAKSDFRKANDNYKKMLTEARDLHRKADDIARQNPDKIKS
jgi:hypothetical protein